MVRSESTRAPRRAAWIVAVVALVGLPSGRALGDSVAIDFEAYAPGTIHGQDGWSSSGAAGSGCAPYDHVVVDNTTSGLPAPATFGTHSLRMSNGVTSGCFGDQTFSKPVANEAGESDATNDGMSGGTRVRRYEAQWDFASTVPGAEQPGLSVVMSPDRGDGARMSWVQMADTPAGLEVNFFDFQTLGGCTGDFVFTSVASGLDRSVPHTIRLVMDAIDGIANDIVRVYVDGSLAHVGTSWEDFFRECQPPGSRTVDSALFRTGGPAAPGTLGFGFLIDNLSVGTSPLTGIVAFDHPDAYMNLDDATAPGDPIPVTWSNDDAGAVAASVWFEDAGGAIPAGCGPFGVGPAGISSVNFLCAGNLPEGTFSFKGLWFDSLGEPSEVASASLTKDTVVLAGTLTSLDADGFVNAAEISGCDSATGAGCPPDEWEANAGSDATSATLWFEDAAATIPPGCGPSTGVLPTRAGWLPADCASGFAEGLLFRRIYWVDAAANTSSILSYSLTKDTIPPVAPAITAPSGDAAFRSSSVTLAGTAPVGETVTLREGSTVLGSTSADPAGQWFLTAGFADGSHTVVASTSDAAGNLGLSGPTTFSVDTVAPNPPVITTPAAGALLNNSTIAIGGTAEVGSSVTLFEGTTNLGSTNANTSGDWSLNRTFSEGSHTVTVTATDAARNTSAASAPRTFTIDTSVSVPSIATPAEGAVTNATSMPVTGTADPGASVAVEEGATTLATVTANATGAWTTAALTFTEGLHTVTARATDAAGNVSAASAARTFEVDLTAPAAPVISAPEEGAELNATPVAVSGTAEAGATVTVLEGATALGSAVADGSGAWSVALAFADGAHSIAATATDAATNTGPASAARAFSLDATVPTVTITTANPSLFVLAPVKIAGTAADASGITSVHVRYIGPGGAVALEGDATLLSPGETMTEWTHEPAGLSNGTYTVEARAVDRFGNQSAAASIQIASVG